MYITSLLKTTTGSSMNAKHWFQRNPLPKYRLIWQKRCFKFKKLPVCSNSLLHIQLLCTSVHLKSITDRQDICFHNQRQLYLSRKLRSITEVIADDTLKLIWGLSFLQDKRTHNSPNSCEYTPLPKQVFEQVYSSLGCRICPFALSPRVSFSLLKGAAKKKTQERLLFYLSSIL